MSTTINKAVVAVIGGLITIAAAFGYDFDIGEETVVAFSTLATAFLVWLIPNKDN